MALSVHNSASEVVIPESLIDEMGFTKDVFRNGEGSLPYRQYLANFHAPGKPALLIFFHGSGSKGEDNFRQCRIAAPPLVRFFKNNPSLKAAILLPQCPAEHRWVDVPWDLPAHDLPEKPALHMRLAMKLLEEKIREFAPDEKKIFASGISMGGFAVWDIAARKPELFSGLFPICGGADLKTAPLLRKMRVWCVHGELDTTVLTSRSREMVQALREAGNESVIYDEVPGAAHNSWDHAFSDDRALEYLFLGKK